MGKMKKNEKALKSFVEGFANCDFCPQKGIEK